MTVRIIHTLDDYVRHITELESNSRTTMIASSFISSHLFDKATVARFFARDRAVAVHARPITDSLWLRRRRIRGHLLNSSYFELFEMDALLEFCRSGIVHRQDPTFSATPKEIVRVLQCLIDLLLTYESYQVGLCREVLPFIFILKRGEMVTLDVRNNFGYQRIQGLVLEDKDIAEEFEVEFWRIWNDGVTISEKGDVLKLLQDLIADAKSGRALIY